MKTVVMNVSDVRSTAVDRVGFDDDGTVYVRFKRYSTWYKGNQFERGFVALALEYFRQNEGSFGTWANKVGLFSNLTPTNARTVYGE